MPVGYITGMIDIGDQFTFFLHFNFYNHESLNYRTPSAPRREPFTSLAGTQACGPSHNASVHFHNTSGEMSVSSPRNPVTMIADGVNGLT